MSEEEKRRTLNQGYELTVFYPKESKGKYVQNDEALVQGKNKREQKGQRKSSEKKSH